MQTDPFVLLSRVAAAPDLFAPGSEKARKAVQYLVATVVVPSITLDGLTAIGHALGDGVDEAFAGLKPATAVTIVKKLDKHGPAPKPADGLARLSHLARGGVLAAEPPPPAPVVKIESLDLDGLVAHARDKGDGFGAWLTTQPAPKVKAALGKFDKPFADRLGADQAAIRARVAALAAGARPVASWAPGELSLADLRTMSQDEPATYDAWTNSKAAKDAAPSVVARFDLAFPGVGTIKATPAMARLKALVGGAKPFPSIEIGVLDVEGLVRARGEMGDGFDLWLKSVPADKLAKAMKNLDPNRPKLDKLKPKECIHLLSKIANGHKPFAAETEVRVIGERAFPVRS